MRVETGVARRRIEDSIEAQHPKHRLPRYALSTSSTATRDERILNQSIKWYVSAYGVKPRKTARDGNMTNFQRYELPRTMGTLPAVSGSRWAPTGGGIPLIVEAAAAALLGFLFGLLLAYLVELHRRYNAQWNW